MNYRVTALAVAIFCVVLLGANVLLAIDVLTPADLLWFDGTLSEALGGLL